MQVALAQTACFWSNSGREAGVQLNGHGSLHVGAVEVGGQLREVWASLISGPGDRYVCDAPNRAHVALEVVLDRRADPAHQDVEVRGLGDINTIGLWSARIPGNNPRERMAFVYDVLLAEAKGNSG
jgi:hypothetical protein